MVYWQKLDENGKCKWKRQEVDLSSCKYRYKWITVVEFLVMMIVVDVVGMVVACLLYSGQVVGCMVVVV